MNSLLDQLSVAKDLTPEQEAFFKGSIAKKTVKKGEIVQYKGDTIKKAYFVVKGLMRTYTIDAKGKEHIYIFAPEGWIVGDLELQDLKEPTEFYIDALEDSEIEVLDPQLMEQHFGNLSPDQLMLEIRRLIKRVSVLQKRIMLLISASAAERYSDFVATYPQIVQRVPQRMIASYLGITPEALSKLKGELVRKK